MKFNEIKVDFNPILRVGDAIRDDGIDMGGTVQKAFPGWWQEEASPWWDLPTRPSFYRHGWMADFNGLELGLETIDYYDAKVSTIDDRFYELVGTGWSLVWAFRVGTGPKTGWTSEERSHLAVFMGLTGLIKRAVLQGSRDHFEREMLMLRLVFDHRELRGRSARFIPKTVMDGPVTTRVI